MHVFSGLMCAMVYLQLVTANEELKKECEQLREGGGKGTSAQTENAPQMEDEVRHLRAQNSALRKNLTGRQCNGTLLLRLP